MAYLAIATYIYICMNYGAIDTSPKYQYTDPQTGKIVYIKQLK